MNYEFYDDMSLINGYPSISFNNLDLYNPYEGFLKGNAFRNEYIPYKNYQIAKVNINSEKDELLFNISEYGFMMHDMNLYLDVNPNNPEVFNRFNEYRNKLNELVSQYERKYGPLRVSNTSNNNFNWIEKWPWVN